MQRELLLLGLLRQRRMHGYQLQEFISRDLEYCTDLKQSTAYNLLKSMADKGWVTTTEEQEGNRPLRTVYQITPEGEVIFQQLLRENLAHHTTMRLPDGIGLAFIDAIPPLEAAELLSQRRSAIQQQLTMLQQARDHGHDHGGLLLIVEHQEIHLNAESIWLAKVIEQLKEMNT
jgi:DNA-binding PadR family transcriptional regulator